MSIRKILLLAFAVVVVAMPIGALAAPPGPDGYFRTGEATQTANHWPFTIDVFSIAHDVKQLPTAKTRQAMIEVEVDKRFVMRMLRDVDADKLRSGLRDGYKRNGYSDSARIDRFLAGLAGTLPKGKAMWITYDAGAMQTRLVVDGGASVTVEGVPFMRATWSIWFGKSKPADVGDALVSQL